MNIDAAITSEIFRSYLLIVGSALAIAGALIGLLALAGKPVGGIWKTYRGWLAIA